MASKRKNGPHALQLVDELPAILAYAVQREVLVTIFLIAVLRALVTYLPGIGWLLNLVLVVGVLKYAAEVLATSANGENEAPSGLGVPDEAGWTLLKVQAVMVLVTIALVYMLATSGAHAWIYAVYALLVLASPAAMASAAIDRDPMTALNPLLWLQTAMRVGGGYLAACLLCVMIGFGEAVAAEWRIPRVPGIVNVLIGYVFSHYALICSFRLIGRMVYVYRDALDYEVQAPPPPLARPLDRDQSTLDAAAQLLSRGDKLAASKLLGTHIQEKGGSDAVHQRYRQLLTELGDQAALTQHSRSYLNVLIANERWPEALDFWAECRTQDAGLWPSDPAQVLELAEQAFKRSRPELTLLFGNGMHVAYPKHEAVAPVYFLVARTMAETQQRRAEARNLLDATLASYPRTKKRTEIEAYLARL